MYIPLNKLKTNLYTNGNEYSLKLTNKEYIGYYWKDYKGKYYTGKTPNDSPTQELISSVAPEVNTQGYPLVQTSILNTPNYQAPTDIDKSTSYDPFISNDYDALIPQSSKNKDLQLPTQYYPYPTVDDYKLGSFQRYFCVKANEDIWLEIDKKTYDALNTRNSKWRWGLYSPFTVEWVLTGDQNKVEDANSSTTKIVQTNSQRRGFQKSLRFNYLKFYKKD